MPVTIPQLEEELRQAKDEIWRLREALKSIDSECVRKKKGALVRIQRWARYPLTLGPDTTRGQEDGQP